MSNASITANSKIIIYAEHDVKTLNTQIGKSVATITMVTKISTSLEFLILNFIHEFEEKFITLFFDSNILTMYKMHMSKIAIIIAVVVYIFSPFLYEK